MDWLRSHRRERKRVKIDDFKAEKPMLFNVRIKNRSQ